MAVWAWIVIAVASVVVVGALVWMAVDRRRSGRLQDRFGPEYDHTIRDAESRRKAESELAERERRREELDIRPLPSAARRRYWSQWQSTQRRFVDAPEQSVRDADALVQTVMRERGYPMDDFVQRAADVSVDHPHVVGNYRSAHAVSVQVDRGGASTEDLRTAILNYRALFEELLVDDEDEAREVG
ncbi:MAG TPA: hypothetical protein VKA30_07450 [Actinomycetota bacterium]|nr:hypothetical protein [Actinomycetota bacterium]